MARFTRANTPLLEPVIALICGILTFALSDRSGYPTLSSFLLLGIFILIISILKLTQFRHSLSWNRIGMWGIFYLIGIGLTAWHRIDPAPAVAHDGERLDFIARIESIPQIKGRWQRAEAILFCYADSTIDNWRPLNDLRIRLFADTSAKNPILRIGDIIRFQGRIYAVDSSGYDLYMFRTRGIAARCFTWNITPLERDTTSRPIRVEIFRNNLGNRLFNATNKETGDIIQALAVGNQADIDPELRDHYSRAGVAHLLSVSGLHVGIIFMIINLLFGWVRLIRRGYTALGVIVIAVLLGYAVLTGLSPSVTRAVIMFSLLQIGLMLSRNTNSFNTLCAAAVLLLLWNPYYIFHIGFQLSFAAMVGIITLYQPLARLWMPRNTIGRWLWSLTLVGATAQIGTFPLVMYHFGQLQLAGLVLNPIIWFTVPVIICGAILYLVSGWEWVFHLIHTVTGWQNSIIGKVAEQPWSTVTGIRITWWLCAIIYLIIIALIIFINRTSTVKTRAYFSDLSEVQLRTAK